MTHSAKLLGLSRGSAAWRGLSQDGAERRGLSQSGAVRRLSPARLAIALSCLLALAACDSPEQKQARYLERGIAYYKENNDAKALIELRNALQLNSKNADAIYYVGLLHERAQRWPQAYAAYQQAVNDRPNFLAAHVKLGTFGLLSNDLDLVRRSVDAIGKIEPDNVDGLALQGALALRQNQPQEAIRLARLALAKSPDNDNGIAVLAGAYQNLGDNKQTMAVLDEAIARFPKKPSLLVLKIALLDKIGDVAGGRKAYGDLIAIDPANENYRLALVGFLQKNSDPAGAEAVLRQTVDSNYGSSRTQSLLVQLIYKNRGFAAAEQELQRQIAAAPKEPTPRFILAELYVQQQRAPDAMAQLNTIIDEAGGEGNAADDARAGLAQIYLANGDPGKARETADLVLKNDPEHRGASLVHGLVALKDEKYDEAISNARTALRRDPAWMPALKLLAEAHLRKGDRDLAINTLNDIVNIDPADTQVAQMLAQLLTQRGDLDTANKVWKLVIDHAQDKGSALQARAQIAIQQKNWQAAQTDINTLLQTQGKESTGATLAGMMMLARDDAKGGRAWFEKAQGLSPAAPEPMIGVVRSYLAQKDTKTAIAYLTEQTAKRPDDPIAFNLLGELNMQEKRVDEARAAFDKAIALQPQWPVPRRQLASLLITNKQLPEAVGVYQAALKAIPNNLDILQDYGSALTTGAQPEQAIEVYDQILALKPDSEGAINNVAAIIADYRYDDPAQLNRALALVQRFRGSDNPFYLDTLGWLYYRKGDFPVAATYLERAVNIRTDRPDLRYHLGMALAKSGRPERAVVELEKAIKDKTDYQGIEEARATLSQIQDQLNQKAAAPGTNG